MKSKSTFGKGLITCLNYFSQHIGRFADWLLIEADYKKNKRLPKDWEGSLEIWHTFENLLSSKIRSWASAATDHLYEIEVPKTWVAIHKKVNKLQDIGLQMGHDFTGKIYTLKDVYKLIELTNEIAIEIDKKIGLKPDAGNWH